VQHHYNNFCQLKFCCLLLGVIPPLLRTCCDGAVNSRGASGGREVAKETAFRSDIFGEHVGVRDCAQTPMSIVVATSPVIVHRRLFCLDSISSEISLKTCLLPPLAMRDIIIASSARAASTTSVDSVSSDLSMESRHSPTNDIPRRSPTRDTTPRTTPPGHAVRFKLCRKRLADLQNGPSGQRAPAPSVGRPCRPGRLGLRKRHPSAAPSSSFLPRGLQPLAHHSQQPPTEQLLVSSICWCY
jgi:hypothetical protein